MTSETANYFPRQYTPRPLLDFDLDLPPLVTAPPVPAVRTVARPRPEVAKKHHGHGFLIAVTAATLAVAASRGVGWQTHRAPLKNAAELTPSASAFPFHNDSSLTYLDIFRLVFPRSGAPFVEETYRSYPTSNTITLGFGEHTVSYSYKTTPEDAGSSHAPLSGELKLSDPRCLAGHVALRAAFSSYQLTGPQHADIITSKACTPNTNLSAINSVAVGGQQYRVSH